MNAIAQTTAAPIAGRTAQAAILGPYDLVPTSPTLAACIRNYRAGNGAEHVPSGVVREASRVLSELAMPLRAAAKPDAFRWLEDLAQSGIAGCPKDQQSVLNAANGIWETCEALPVGVWCKETRLAFQAAQRFFPAPADVFQFLTPYADALRWQRTGCTAILEVWKNRKQITEAEATPEITLEVKDRVSSLIRGMAFPTTGQTAKPFGTRPDDDSVKPMHSPPHILLQSYIRAVSDAPTPDPKRLAELSVSRLRANLGLTEGQSRCFRSLNHPPICCTTKSRHSAPMMRATS